MATYRISFNVKYDEESYEAHGGVGDLVDFLNEEFDKISYSLDKVKFSNIIKVDKLD